MDHFIVSQNCVSHVISYEVAHDGNNLSDHNAVCICLSFDVMYNDVTDDEFRPHPLSKRATVSEICDYKYTLAGRLNNINVPHDVITCTD